MSIVAIIPARGGSKGVPQKNIRFLQGFPLIAYSIIAAKLSRKIDRVIVSTDSENIADIAKAFGAEVPFLRPSQFATDKSPDNEFVLHALDWFQTNEGNTPRLLVHLRPTTPLRDPILIDEAIEALLKQEGATSLRSGHVSSESPYKWFLRNKEGYFDRTLGGYSTETANLPRQEFPTVYIPNGYVDILKTKFVLSTGMLHGDKIIGYESPFCCEVDSLSDFEFLEFAINKNGSIILNYLEKNHQDLKSNLQGE